MLNLNNFDNGYVNKPIIPKAFTQNHFPCFVVHIVAL